MQHRDATAGWVCDSCESKLCPACAASKTTAAGETILCTRCGGSAQPIFIKRGELEALSALKAQASPFGGLRALVRGQKPSARDDELVPVLGDTQPLIQLAGGEGEEGGPVGLDSAGNPLSDAAQKPRTYEPIALDDDGDGDGSFEVERGLLGQPSPVALVPPQELELELDPGEEQAQGAPPPAPVARTPAASAPPAYAGARPPPPPVIRPPPPPAAPAARPPPAPPDHSLQTSEGANEVLAGLFAQGQQTECLDVLDRSGLLLRAETLAPQSWLLLGTFALDQKRAKAATFALRRCIDAAPEGVHAPPVWLLAARTYDQLIGDRKTSDRLLLEVATRFPRSKEGQFAARRLAAAKG